MKQPKQLLLTVFVAVLLFSACTKVPEITSKHSTGTTTTSDQDELVATPGGLLPRSHVHAIENGYAVLRNGGHLYKIERQSGNIVEDFGPIKSSAEKRSIGGRPHDLTPSVSPMAPTWPNNAVAGWLTYAYWEYTGSGILKSLQTNYTVPSIPTTPNDNQLIYLYNGVSDVAGIDILQPVLQFGASDYFNPNGKWCITNWYVSNGLALYNPNFITVDPNTNLEGLISFDNYNGGSYNYTSSFINPATGIAYNNVFYAIQGQEYENEGVPAIPAQVFTVETLEAYHGLLAGVTAPSDYPAGQNYLAMSDIWATDGVPGGSTSGQIPSWTEVNNNTPNGENVDITPPINNSTNGGGEVYIYWHPIPTINNTTLQKLTTTHVSYTISAYTGTPVNVVLTGFDELLGKINGTTTTTLTITTPGVTFTNGSTTVSATNGTSYYSIAMPPSGSITVTGYYTTTGHGSLIVATTQTY
ncbi:MAG TPA: hypothetical protein VFE32_10175 [Puia sp.]|jgi:hypothetical protein|nr:hypothetical protein [Puia sp.]